MRLDLVLIARHPGLSRRKAREVIEKGQVLLGGSVVLDAGLTVPEDADLLWDPNRKARSRARSSLRILFEDETVVVVDKPAGLLAVPTSPEGADTEDTALARVLDYVRHLRPHKPYVGVVHRLDRDTSGALAFALTPGDRTALRALFREHRIERRYSALVSGLPPGDQGVVDLPIRDSYLSGRREVARGDEPAKPALTRWTVVERFTAAALLDVQIETGRQHQIRLHLAHVGLPVVGDAVYARPRPVAKARPGRPPDPARAKAPPPAKAKASAPVVGAPRQMLHARKLGFTHPLSGRVISVESPLPEDFEAVLTRLRHAKRHH